MSKVIETASHFRDQALLEVQGVSYSYRGSKEAARALRSVSFAIRPGEILALIGESGSGKSTLARIISGLLPASEGRLVFRGEAIEPLVQRRTAEVLRQIQIVFQNPDASLNPRHRVGTIIGRPLRHFLGLNNPLLKERVSGLLADVRLPADYADRYPAELSGGERQRVAVARALAAEPQLLVCDEITSALDVSVKASLLDLLKEVQSRTGFALLFITHDLPVVRWFADRAVVLQHGEVCEDTAIPELFQQPQHSYTASLIDAVSSRYLG
jgi:peptide/nickel transport system ATP-binding protein